MLKNLKILQTYNNMGIKLTEKIPNDFTMKNNKKFNNINQLKLFLETNKICDLQEDGKNMVFADGNPNSDIMIFGEAPGLNEDINGIPFCGKSGKMLDKMLESINLNRESVYITNPVFWRPTNNRKPTIDEINQCATYVAEHIALIKPKVILLLGAVATYSILRIEKPISEIRGTMQYYDDALNNSKIPAISTFHPAYLFRQPSKKDLVKDDLNMLKKIIAEDFAIL